MQKEHLDLFGLTVHVEPGSFATKAQVDALLLKSHLRKTANVYEVALFVVSDISKVDKVRKTIAILLGSGLCTRGFLELCWQSRSLGEVPVAVGH